MIGPGFLTNGAPRKQYRVLTDLTRKRAGRISRADATDFISKQINKPDFLRKPPLPSY